MKRASRRRAAALQSGSNSPPRSDADWLAVAARLAERARPLSRPNPSVGCIVVKDGVVVGRGWTQPGGRPHAEAMALSMAGDRARVADVYVTLEPCAHRSERGPACADLLAAAKPARVIVGVEDPDPRTAGEGIGRLRDAAIDARLMPSREAEDGLAGYLTRARLGRPHVTLKLAMSLDRLGQKDAACSSFAELATKFPTAPQSVKARAQSERQRVGCQ